MTDELDLDPLAEAMFAAVGGWAKAARPKEYAATIAVVARPPAFEAYLARLIELRVAAEPAWRNTLPCSVLDATSLVVTLRHKQTGTAFQVHGRRTRAESRGLVTFGELAQLTPADLGALLVAHELLDLERVRYVPPGLTPAQARPQSEKSHD